jgi:hypothetical protein
MRRSATLLVVALALAAIPAHAQRRRDPLLLSDKPAPRQGCTVSQRPSPLPALATLADSAALSAAVEMFARRHPIADGKMFAVYSVAFTADGNVERVAPVDYWLPQGMEPDVNALVRQSLKAQRPGAAWSVRVRFDADSTVTFRVGRSETCPPRATTRFELVTPAVSQTRPPTPVLARVLVGADGRVRSLSLVRTSGEPELDRWVHDNLLRHAFTPGLVDGVAVEMARDEEVRIQHRP